MSVFAHTNGMMDGNIMTNGDSVMTGGMYLMGLLWILLLLVLITLGIMAVVILYRRYFAKEPRKKK